MNDGQKIQSAKRRAYVWFVCVATAIIGACCFSFVFFVCIRWLNHNIRNYVPISSRVVVGTLSSFCCGGRTVIAGSKDIVLIVATTLQANSNLSWVLQQPYEAHLVSDFNESGRIHEGGRVASYVRYILDNWDSLPEYMLFLHDHKASWHVRDIVELVKVINPRAYSFMGVGNSYALSLSGKKLLLLQSFLTQAVQDDELLRMLPNPINSSLNASLRVLQASDRLKFMRGSFFLVSRQCMLNRTSKAVWQQIFDWLQQHPKKQKALDFSWHILFTRQLSLALDPAQLCPRRPEACGFQSSNDGDRFALPYLCCKGQITIPGSRDVVLIVATTLRTYSTWGWVLHQPYEAHIVSDFNETGRRHQGLEAASYIRYIIDNWDALPEYMLFLHDHRTSWHMSDTLELLKVINPQAYDFMGIGTSHCSALDGKRLLLLHHFFSNAVQDDQLLHMLPKPVSSLPKSNGPVYHGSDRVTFMRGGSFLVSRQRMLTYTSKATWQRVFEWLQKYTGKYLSQAAECSWHILFTRQLSVKPNPRQLCPKRPHVCRFVSNPQYEAPSETIRRRRGSGKKRRLFDNDRHLPNVRHDLASHARSTIALS